MEEAVNTEQKEVEPRDDDGLSIAGRPVQNDVTDGKMPNTMARRNRALRAMGKAGLVMFTIAGGVAFANQKILLNVFFFYFLLL